MKLSKTQLEVLKELAEEGNFLHHMPRFCGEHSYWFFNKSLKRVRYPTERVLYKYGLISQYTFGGHNDLRAKITDKGRKFINDPNRID